MTIIQKKVKPQNTKSRSKRPTPNTLGLRTIYIKTPQTAKTKKLSRKKKKRLISTIRTGLKRIATKVKQSTSKNRGRRPRRNYSKRSYFSKFILRKMRKYNRIKRPVPGSNIQYKFRVFLARTREKRKRDAILKNKRISNKIKNKIKRKRKEDLTYGLITMRHVKRNFFISIHKFLDASMKYDPNIKLLEAKGNSRNRKRIAKINKHLKKKRNKKPKLQGRPYAFNVIFKSSVGITGYRGPKRSSHLGKQRVARAASNFLRRNNFTAVDLRFPRKITKHYSFILRTLLRTRFWVRKIYFAKQRSHGFTRLRKMKRK